MSELEGCVSALGRLLAGTQVRASDHIELCVGVCALVVVHVSTIASHSQLRRFLWGLRLSDLTVSVGDGLPLLLGSPDNRLGSTNLSGSYLDDFSH